MKKEFLSSLKSEEKSGRTIRSLGKKGLKKDLELGSQDYKKYSIITAISSLCILKTQE